MKNFPSFLLIFTILGQITSSEPPFWADEKSGDYPMGPGDYGINNLGPIKGKVTITNHGCANGGVIERKQRL